MFSSQTEMPMKSILRIEVDASELKIGIKPFLRFPVLRIELVDVVVIQVEWLSVLSGSVIFDGLSSMGWLSSRLQTRLTSRSGDIPHLVL